MGWAPTTSVGSYTLYYYDSSSTWTALDTLGTVDYATVDSSRAYQWRWYNDCY
jgi:hypothetical protein